MSTARATQQFLSVLRTGAPDARASRQFLSVVRQGLPIARVSRQFLEVVYIRPASQQVFFASSTGAQAVEQNDAEWDLASVTTADFALSFGGDLVYETVTQASQHAANDAAWEFTTEVDTGQWEAVNDPMELTTDVTLGAALGGTLASTATPGAPSYSTVTGVLATALYSPPTLVSYATTTTAGEALTINLPITFATDTGARVGVAIYEDGRRDLLSGRRYRR